MAPVTKSRRGDRSYGSVRHHAPAVHHSRTTATAVESRPYRGSFDLRSMQQLLVRNASTTEWHVGDLAWAMREHPHLELTLLVRLFFVGDELIGWTWVRGRGLIEIELLAKYRDTVLYDAMIEAGEEIIDAMRRAGDEVGELRARIPDDDGAMAAAFTRRGFAPTDLALQQNQRLSHDEVPEPWALPDEWAFAAVDTDARIACRVECHRAAFAPSILTIEAYRRARACWPYRADLDRVILDDSGAVVAACTAWLDEANGEGLLEPVATCPGQQRRGYGRAVCVDALRALRQA